MAAKRSFCFVQIAICLYHKGWSYFIIEVMKKNI